MAIKIKNSYYYQLKTKLNFVFNCFNLFRSIIRTRTARLIKRKKSEHASKLECLGYIASNISPILMRKTLLLTIMFLSILSAKAQVTIRSGVVSFESFREGYYYDKDGQRIIGLIKFVPYLTKIVFKTDKDAKKQNVDIDDIKAVVVKGWMSDSVIVLTKDNKDRKRYFAKPLSLINTARFYLKFESKNGTSPPDIKIGGVANSNSPGFHNTYTTVPGQSFTTNKRLIMYQDGNTTYELKKGNYIEVLSKAFAEYPDLVKQIQNKEYKFKDIEAILVKYSKPL